MSIFSDITDKIEMKKCPKGHLYNSHTHVECPFCNKIEEFSEKIEEFKAERNTGNSSDGLGIIKQLKKPSAPPAEFKQSTTHIIREANMSDFDDILELYTYLHDNPFPEKTVEVMDVWNTIISTENHHLIVAEDDCKIVSTCVCVITPNLTHNQRPYAFVENVVTHPDYRNRGLASACLDYAKELATEERCYKLMLLSGSKQESTLRFYERAGYNRNDKTAFVQWI